MKRPKETKTFEHPITGFIYIANYTIKLENNHHGEENDSNGSNDEMLKEPVLSISIFIVGGWHLASLSFFVLVAVGWPDLSAALLLFFSN